MSDDVILRKGIRVYPEMIPADLVEVRPMGPSLDQKEKDGTLTEKEAFMLHALRIHQAVTKWEEDIII